MSTYYRSSTANRWRFVRTCSTLSGNLRSRLRVGSIALALLVASITATPTAAQTGSPATDRAALVALYEATDGSHWGNNANWLSDEPLDSWYGVTTDDSGRVSKLSLIGIGLSGTIPPELGSLANLDRLNLDHNRLSGQIPSRLRILTNLTELSLSGNQLNGRIPSQLGSLTNLESLNLSNNGLSRQIPSELGSLTNLTELSLIGNELSGQIPRELGDLANLTKLYLSPNPPKDGVRTAEGGVRELRARWPGLHWGRWEGGGRSSVAAQGAYGRLRGLRCAGW